MSVIYCCKGAKGPCELSPVGPGIGFCRKHDFIVLDMASLLFAVAERVQQARASSIAETKGMIVAGVLSAWLDGHMGEKLAGIAFASVPSFNDPRTRTA